VGNYVLPWLGLQTLASHTRQSTAWVADISIAHGMCFWYCPHLKAPTCRLQWSRANLVAVVLRYMLPLQYQSDMSQCGRTEKARAAYTGVDASHIAVGLDELVQHK
jgi:hypothetical protein